ncbi:ribosomal protein S18 acetylase RimI-like enzyme [Kribbella amoyensis]|uniref:Ribosomal protein S18 acetylase RimI-like enzyme n=1 Tax=Kribbella amoyensis TaxID=996641 RepID=A0A561BNL3_9ACTN|nr:GNAT family N-acetyltransferase [Kribbella amoyensis]TWD80459.1 ribosomal protein S18 acetylase RimI-like enzyme [Kribbella amoyensis]
MTEIEVRRAGPDDAPALVRLRGLMLEAMGQDLGGPDAPWRDVALRYFTDQLSSPASFAAFVADDPEAGVVANAAGHVTVHPPGPKDPTTLRGALYNVSTEPAFRRRGLARACVTALLDWYRDETGVGQVELHATEEGAELYHSLGFVDSRYSTQRLHVPR